MHNLYYKSLIDHFPHDPTEEQLEVMAELTDFLLLPLKKNLFILKGYAGTGKTTLIAALVKTLKSFNVDSVLLAPTGRAAKVMANYSEKPAFTIHKMIYVLKNDGDGFTRFVIRPNKFQNTIFLVDEASMINDGGGLLRSAWGETKSLLDDLFEYVYSGINCKLIFIGDTAQLPPVGMDSSPALDQDFLQRNHQLTIVKKEITEVVRQQKQSEIVFNATHLRMKISSKDLSYPLFVSTGEEVKRITGEELEDIVTDAYGKYGEENVAIICRSNKRANLFNLQIRARIRWLEDEIATGDYMMVVKNNYFWLPDSSKAGFVANGDTVEILKIKGIEELYGFRFANVTVRMVDYPEEPNLEIKILMDSILTESPSLPYDEHKRLYEAVSEDYAYEPNRKKRNELIRKNPYYQALQVKFAYAVTCHKSQGGQWSAVIVDQGYLTEEMIDVAYLRWLYTAMTRAQKELYLVNFNESFFEKE